MWSGGGGASTPDSEGTNPQLDIEGTSPIPIRLNQDKEILKVFIQIFRERCERWQFLKYD